MGEFGPVPVRSLLKNEPFFDALPPLTFSAGIAEGLLLHPGARGHPIRLVAGLSADGFVLRREIGSGRSVPLSLRSHHTKKWVR